MQPSVRNVSNHNFLGSSFSSAVSMDLDSSWAAKSWQMGYTTLPARFQQKQLQEKEQKLLRLYESQQLRAIQRVGRGSAGSSVSSTSSTTSTTSTSSLGNGKVRQLFDERRTQGKTARGAGWDRSYPLEPLDNARSRSHPVNGHQRITRGASLDRINIIEQPIKKSVTRSKSQIRPGNLIHGDNLNGSYRYNDYDYPYDDYNSQDNLNSSYNRDNNNYNRLNYREREPEPLFTKSRHYQSEYEEPLRNGEVFDQSQLFKKLTNVGGILLMKERTMNEDRYKTYNAGTRKGAVGATGAAAPKQPLTTRRDNGASPPSKMATKPVAKSQTSSNASSPVNGSTQRPSLLREPGQVNSTSPRRPTPPTMANRPAPPQARQAPPQSGKPAPPPSARQAPSQPSRPPLGGGGASARPVSSVRGGPPANNPDLRDCKVCGRHFASDRIAMHQEICAKTAQKKRKVFDPLKQRVKGTEAEAYVRMNKKQPPKPVKKADWRRKHEDFINTIRAAKGMQAHVAAGGKLSDLPPPPPSDYSDYIQCPHCGRKFNEAAAERHIPRCATMEHNKPKPQAKGAPAAARKR